MRKIVYFLVLLYGMNLYSIDRYEESPIARIDIFLETEDPSVEVDKKAILTQMQSKVGDPFSQTIFDGDLKQLSQDYDRILHDEKIVNGKIYITLRLWPKPIIRDINWVGNNKIKSSKLQSQLDISSGSVFDRKTFNEQFNKVKEYYIKQGFFEAQLLYHISPVKGKNQVDVEIDIKEGKSGNIQKVILLGFSDTERSAIYAQMATRKYNFATSWLTGYGYYDEERIQQDRMTIINYLHNRGYSDAKVDIEVKDEPVTGQILVVIRADRGPVYTFGNITFEGNSLISDEEIQNALTVSSGEPFSPEELHNAIQSVKDAYGKLGYIETLVDYDTELLLDQPSYNIHLRIDEGGKFRIGMIHIIGNETTRPNVILRESLLIPGETFDTRKLKATQARLENIGFFKNVNVYAVRTVDDDIFGPGYRDVYIEVEETSTGSINLSIGANSTASVTGTLELSEKNFCLGGLRDVTRRGLGALRGGGEYFSVKGSLGAKQKTAVMTWMDPYFRDSFWRVGTTISYISETIRSDNQELITYGAEFFAAYPFNNYLTFGNRYRIRHVGQKISSEVDETQSSNRQPQEVATTREDELANVGLLSAYGVWLSYNSTDRIYKPYKGVRSELRLDLSGLGGDFYFFKSNFTNSFYIPVTLRSTLKLRGDVGFIVPFDAVVNVDATENNQNQVVPEGGGSQKPNPFGGIPPSERFYLGGVETVRGYKPLIIGPKFINAGDPAGGISYSLLSAEYLYRLLPVIDLFGFFDAGTVNEDKFKLGTYRMSYGFGVRLEIIGGQPITLGLGYPINPVQPGDVENFFFQFGAQF